MRVTTAFKRLLCLDGVNVASVVFSPREIVVTVVLRRRRLACPHCSYVTSSRYDTRQRPSRWRHLDLGVWQVEIRAQLRRLYCPFFDDDLEPAEAIELLDRWISRASRSRLAPFVKAAKTMRQRRGLIINALEHGINNGRVEGLNTKVRLIIRRGYGFHTADAALALVMLACGPITLQLPHEHHHAKPVAQAA